MPYKSQAQRRLFHWLESQGKLSPGVVEEYDRESKGKKMPEYVKKKAFGGEVEAKAGVHCPACDYPLDSAPVALDAGEGCPRCGYGEAKDVPHKAHGGEVMEPTTYRARGGEVERKRRGDVEYKAETAKEFLDKLNYAVTRMKRQESNLPYNPAPYRERTEQERRPAVMSPDPSIPREKGIYETMAWHKDILPKHYLGDLQDQYEDEPTPENAQRINKKAKELANKDPDFARRWAKNTVSGFGDVKMADRYAHGGEVYVPLKALGGMVGNMKEMYPRKKDEGARLDDGKGGFAKALRRRR